MKRAVLLRLSALLLPLFLAVACGDLPTATRAPDLAGAGPMLSGECIPNGDGLYICPPISGGGGECDEYHYDCGGDDCISSTGPGALDAATVQGCTGGSGGGGTIGDGGGTGGGGGGSGNQAPWCPDNDCSPPPDEGALADDELADCIDLGCRLRDPTPGERQRILDLIGTLRTDGFCAEVRESALRMVNRQVQVWDNRTTYPETGGTLYGAAPWDYSRGGHVMYIWTGSLTAWTIAHEAIHGIWNPSGIGHYYTHSDITPAGRSLNDTARYCSGR